MSFGVVLMVRNTKNLHNEPSTCIYFALTKTEISTDQTPPCRVALPRIEKFAWLNSNLQQTANEGTEGMTGRRQAGRQTVRRTDGRTEAARKHGKGRLTNCFCPLWEGAARHGLVWALTFRRVKSDPRRREEEEKEVKRGWEEWKRKIRQRERDIEWKKNKATGGGDTEWTRAQEEEEEKQRIKQLRREKRSAGDWLARESPRS